MSFLKVGSASKNDLPILACCIGLYATGSREDRNSWALSKQCISKQQDALLREAFLTPSHVMV